MPKNEDLSVRWQRLGRAVDQIGLAMGGYRDLAVEVTGLSVRAPDEARPEFFLVIRGLDAEGAPVVAFHSAFSLDEAFVGLEARLLNGSLRWRVDEYARG